MPARVLVTRRLAAVTAAVVVQLAAPGPTTAPAFAMAQLTCHASVPGVTARGVPTTFRYDDGRAFAQRRGPDALGYQPRDLALPHRSTTTTRTTARTSARASSLVTTKRSYWFTLSGQQLREVIEVDRLDGTGKLLSADYRSRLVRKNWSGIRQMSIGQGRKYLYVLNNKDQLQRYVFGGKNGSATVRFDKTVGTGFGTLGSFEYVRTFSVLGSKYDVFLATDADKDELLEYTIPVSNPTAYYSTLLDQGGWADMRATGRTASCVGVGGMAYDAIVGVDVFGDVYLWTDRNGSDGSGADIVSRGLIKDGWRPLAYSN
ncbi:hypothetical protein ISU10_18985 [Nocardioides agariphilus]|jgi:hypothetical protein|uniref:Tachylectin n=1 Tax=Nocardioides agariphilus TaxID=433664 RepID=A0A930VQA8_9ACTN|nr:hypothetical protein [Nocardioides agariphilus]MBF4769861.1 hypothetical protein [Nocardioides agariphilus]